MPALPKAKLHCPQDNFTYGANFTFDFSKNFTNKIPHKSPQEALRLLGDPDNKKATIFSWLLFYYWSDFNRAFILLIALFLSPHQRGASRVFLLPSPVRRWITVSSGRRESRFLNRE